MTQQEALAEASSEGAEYIRQIHEQCFSGDIGLVDRAYAVAEVTPQAADAMDATALNSTFKAKIMVVEAAMNSVMQDPGFNTERRVEVLGAVRAVTSMMIKLNDLLIAIGGARSTAAAAVSGAMTSDVDASWRYMATNGDDTQNPLQRLYKIAFERARQLGYARYKDCLMKRRITSDGFITNAWEKVSLIQDFIYDLTSEPVGEIQSLASKTANGMEQVAELMSKKREVELPWLKPDRRVFAFRNGCYMAKEERFITFSREAPPMMPDGKPCPTACKYHDSVIDLKWIDCEDPMFIPTPLMTHIMDTQQLSPDVKRVYFSMLGRAIYDLGEMDNWQVFLFIKGQAETGKSTLLQFVSSFYNREDVGVLANNIEGTFGASMIAEKFIVIGDDLGESLSLDQQLFQNMSSGNEVSLPRKNKSALILKWITQLMLSGNVLPDYKDNSGSFSRRLLIVHYSKPIRHVDPTIPERLTGEIGAAIIKCNRCYRNMVRRFHYLLTREERPVTFWDAVPEEFRIQKRNVMQCANAFMSFLNSGTLVFGPSLYMAKDMFVNQLMNHCTTNAIPRPKFQATQYEGAFAIMGLDITKSKQKKRYPRTPAGKDMTEIWITGCDMATSDAINNATTDSIRQAEEAVGAYVQDPAAIARAAAAAMRKRPRSVAFAQNPGDQQSAAQRPKLP
jgi:hypothetical protein